MAKKFAPLLINQITWRLLRRSFIAALGLAFILYDDFSWRSLFVFFAVLLFIYLRSGEDRKRVRVLFWFLSLIFVAGLNMLSLASSLLSFFWVAAAFCAAFAALNFVILGVINFSYFAARRSSVFRVAQTFVFFLVFIVAQRLLFSSSVWIFAIFAVLVLFFKEALLFYFSDGASRRKINLISVASGIIASEFILLVRFLPLSFISASVFAALFSFLLRDALAAHLSGKLSAQYVLREVTIFILFTLIIFATARWTI